MTVVGRACSGSPGGGAEPPGQVAEQFLLIVTHPRHVAVRSQQRRGDVQLVADVDHVVHTVGPAGHREPAGLVQLESVPSA
jgi:hypothetical protein